MNAGNLRNNIHLFTPEKHLPAIRSEEVKYSSGFLKAHFPVWFSGIANHWYPFFAELGVEIESIKISTTLTLGKENLKELTRFSIGNGLVSVLTLPSSLSSWGNYLSPSLSGEVKEVFFTYLGMRITGSLAATFSAQDHIPIKQADGNASFVPRAQIAVQFLINSKPGSLYFVLDEPAVQIVDENWKKYLRSSTRSIVPFGQVADVLLARLSVASDSLGKYLESGNFIDLESVNLQDVLISTGRDTWKEGELYWNEEFGVVVKVNDSVKLTTPPNYLQLLITYSTENLTAEQSMDLNQTGSYIPLSNRAPEVTLHIEGEQVGTGKLFTNGLGYYVQVS